MAKLEKKKTIFQKAYKIDGSNIFITNTPRGKKKFLKAGIKNVVFGEEFLKEPLFSDKIHEVHDYDKDFILNYVPNMIEETVNMLKLSLPLEEIVIFSSQGAVIADKCVKFTRLVTIVGEEGDDYFENGVPVRFLRKMKKIPALFILDDEKKCVSPLLKKGVIDIREKPMSGQYFLAWDKTSFKTDLSMFEISLPQLIYFLKKGEIITYEVTSYRKKSQRLFTFS